MFDIGGGELIVIVIAILILFGPKKIPEIAQMIGKGMQQFRKAQSQFQSQFSDIQSEIKSAVGNFDEPFRVRPSKNIDNSVIPTALVVETSDDTPIVNESSETNQEENNKSEIENNTHSETTHTNKNNKAE